MSKNIIERFEKDFFAILNTILILGIIIEGKQVWTYQIKKRFSELNEYRSSIPDSSLYSTLNKLEHDYGLIVSIENESVQRRYFKVTSKGIEEFTNATSLWSSFCSIGVRAIEKLELQ